MQIFVDLFFELLQENVGLALGADSSNHQPGSKNHIATNLVMPTRKPDNANKEAARADARLLNGWVFNFD